MRLYGKRSVLERLKADPKSIKKVYLKEGVCRPEIAHLAKKKNIQVESLSAKRFFQLAQNVHAQGVMAEVDKFRYHDFEELISQDKQRQPTLICLDRINDPQNLGVILRNCACFGGFAVVLPKHETTGVTEAVLKVACGGENYTPVCLVTNLSSAIHKAKEQGYWVGATVVEGGQSPRQLKFNFPLCLLFGSEGEGIRPGLLKHIDYKLTLPMQGAGLSFNVAMAVTIFCYELTTQNP
ncbi:MAG: 23S rRNA (guanosine(2251)-2'-O)-methyltransferase RlmB [Candidatus Omnitrophica bacterium]|nr:23S rRNA (guanosine(2251)-2'-O)-methyltransferase RlmB [Candidatus Omnitrophota bacterium]